MPKKVDLTGQRFDKLIILEDDGHRTNNGKILWKCKCDCGNICYKKTEYFHTKSSKPKACSIRCSSSIDIGTRFGKLVVIERLEEKGKETYYKCKCDCGKETIVSNMHLKHNITKSCGCLRQEKMSNIGKENILYADLKNKKFGKLIALEPTNERINRSVIWKCKCECGNIHYATVGNLQNGYVTRCSNCNILSKGEEKIFKLLIDNNISFEKEKTFDSCINPKTNKLLRFDFWVKEKYIIEFDGIQHFLENKYFISSLKDIQERDKIKNSWCKDNNIPLIRIPYTHLENLCLEDLLLETTKYLIK